MSSQPQRGNPRATSNAGIDLLGRQRAYLSPPKQSKPKLPLSSFRTAPYVPGHRSRSPSVVATEVTATDTTETSQLPSEAGDFSDLASRRRRVQNQQIQDSDKRNVKAYQDQPDVQVILNHCLSDFLAQNFPHGRFFFHQESKDLVLYYSTAEKAFERSRDAVVRAMRVPGSKLKPHQGATIEEIANLKVTSNMIRIICASIGQFRSNNFRNMASFLLPMLGLELSEEEKERASQGEFNKEDLIRQRAQHYEDSLQSYIPFDVPDASHSGPPPDAERGLWFHEACIEVIKRAFFGRSGPKTVDDTGEKTRSSKIGVVHPEAFGFLNGSLNDEERLLPLHSIAYGHFVPALFSRQYSTGELKSKNLDAKADESLYDSIYSVLRADDARHGPNYQSSVRYMRAHLFRTVYQNALKKEMKVVNARKRTTKAEKSTDQSTGPSSNLTPSGPPSGSPLTHESTPSASVPLPDNLPATSYHPSPTQGYPPVPSYSSASSSTPISSSFTQGYHAGFGGAYAVVPNYPGMASASDNSFYSGYGGISTTPSHSSFPSSSDAIGGLASNAPFTPTGAFGLPSSQFPGPSQRELSWPEMYNVIFGPTLLREDQLLASSVVNPGDIIIDDLDWEILLREDTEAVGGTGTTFDQSHFY
ncbi:hypothetical protein CVT26_011474 [Gymnopilus dilepis]|uniref:DUF6532 domain-containing protein n=1 Tax=Gymnopilus dilepis TaxID=231916 RepID=A0A409W8P9_9AGAR|nr:hypothetical protein CVT26_011474 [Gymnopilus dilepis]